MLLRARHEGTLCLSFFHVMLDKASQKKAVGSFFRSKSILLTVSFFHTTPCEAVFAPSCWKMSQQGKVVHDGPRALVCFYEVFIAQMRCEIQYRVTAFYGLGRTVYTFFFEKKAKPITAETSNVFLYNMTFLTHSTRIAIIFIVIAPQSDRNHMFSNDFQWQNCLCRAVCSMGLPWSLAADMASGKMQYTIHRRRRWQCIPVSDVSVDHLAGKGDSDSTGGRAEDLEKVSESRCHHVHEHPERWSLVPPQSWLDDWDAMQFNFGHGLGTVHEVPLESTGRQPWYADDIDVHWQQGGAPRRRCVGRPNRCADMKRRIGGGARVFCSLADIFALML